MKCSDERCLFRDTETQDTKPTFTTLATVTREGKGLWEKCDHCGLVINRSGVTPEEQKEFYNSTYMSRNSFSQGEMVDARKHFEIRLETIASRAEYLKPFLNSSSVVFELGAGTGELLYLLKDYVGRCIGNEIIDTYVHFMKTELGLEAFGDNYLEYQLDTSPDCIISIATIDHIYDTKSYVEKMVQDVKQGGYLYIEVPNDDQALNRFLPGNTQDDFRRFMYQKAHYYSFNMDTFRRFIDQYDVDIVDTFTRHEYSLYNYLNWYFTGSRQKDISVAKGVSLLHEGRHPFEIEMNRLFQEMDNRFKEIISTTGCGEMLCLLCRKR